MENKCVSQVKELTVLQRTGEASSYNLDFIMVLNKRIKEKIVELDGERPEKNEDTKQQCFYGYINQLLDSQNMIKNNLSETDSLLTELFKLI